MLLDHRHTPEIEQELGGLPVTALFSTLGRTAARGLECSWAAHALKAEFNKRVANIKAGDSDTFDESKWDPKNWPKSSKGAVLRAARRSCGVMGRLQCLSHQ